MEAKNATEHNKIKSELFYGAGNMNNKKHLNKLMESKSRFLRAMLEGTDLMGLIKIGENLLGKPIALNTISHFAWYVSSNMPQNCIVPQTGGAEVKISHLYEFREMIYQFLDEFSAQHLLNMEGNYYLFCPVFDNRRLLGYSCLVSEELFTEWEKELHKVFCHVIAAKLARHEISRRVLLMSEEETFLMNILDDAVEDNGNSDMDQLFPKDIYMETIVVQMRESMGNLAPPFRAVDELKKILKCDICFGYYGSLVALAGMGSSHANRKQFESILSKYDMVAGVSYPLNRSNCFRISFEQSQTAVRMGREKLINQLMFYTDCVFHDLISQVEDYSMLIFLCNSDIYRLTEYDKTNQTNLSHTLKTWFESGGNTAETAVKLGIHRNSVMRRMDTIKELATSVDAFTLDGYFSLLMIDYIQNHE